MRRNFAQILANSSIDIPREYDKLTDILYCNPIEAYSGKTLYDEINECFAWFHFHGTCLSLQEFDDQYGFDFPEAIAADEIDTFVSFCEYFYNLLTEYNRITNPSVYSNPPQIELYWTQIGRVMDSIGYMRSEMDGFSIYVERSAAAVAVAENPMIPEVISYKLISYNHHSMQGNLQEKKNTILSIADLLEPKRKDLDRVDKELSSDLFYLFNNLNLRHNNIDSVSKGKYKRAVAEMPPEQLEEWYDETYQMCLLAFMTLEHADRKMRFDELKEQIEAK